MNFKCRENYHCVITDFDEFIKRKCISYNYISLCDTLSASKNSIFFCPSVVDIITLFRIRWADCSKEHMLICTWFVRQCYEAVSVFRHLTSVLGFISMILSMPKCVNCYYKITLISFFLTKLWLSLFVKQWKYYISHMSLWHTIISSY